MSSTPPLLHRAASSQLFMALMCVPFYCTTVAAVLFCFLSLCHVCSRYIPVSLSITCSLYSSAVAQRQVVISACGVSFQYLCFFSLFLLLRHLSPLLTAAFFVFLFSLLLLLHHHFHHLSFSFTFSLFPLCFLWQLCLPSPLALPSHLHSFPCS